MSRSTSSNGQATISVQWDYGLDDDKVVSNIRNAVDSHLAGLPADVTTDVITGSTDDIPVLLLAVSTDLPLAESGRARAERGGTGADRRSRAYARSRSPARTPPS